MPREQVRTSVRAVSNQANRPRLYRAYLGETYDGIGQYVKITLSRNAVSVGLLARVGSGDFGTAQTIPEGTPVTVVSYHGRLDILSMGAK